MRLIEKLASLAKRPGKPVMGRVEDDPFMYLRAYPSRGLTPEGLGAIFSEADEGRPQRQMELYEEMEEKDAHLGAVLQSRKLAVTGLQWDIVAGGGTEADESAAAFVREALGGIGNLHEGLAALMDAAGKGFAVVEVIWEIVGDRALIRELRPHAQRGFTFFGKQGIERRPRMLTPDEPVYGEELMAGKFVVHTGVSRGVPAFRAGVLRPCAWMYLFKHFTLKDWLIFAERYAQPMRVGKFTPGASEAERRVLKQAVFNLGTDAAAVISDSTVIELLESGGKKASAEVYESLARYCDSAMSKAVLGQTLTTEQTGGTYATARVHEAVRHDIIKADAASLARTLSTQIIGPLVEYNFGSGPSLPVVRFRHEPEGDLKELAETYAALQALGLKIPESHLRERFGIPAMAEVAGD